MHAAALLALVNFRGATLNAHKLLEDFSLLIFCGCMRSRHSVECSTWSRLFPLVNKGGWVIPSLHCILKESSPASGPVTTRLESSSNECVQLTSVYRKESARSQILTGCWRGNFVKHKLSAHMELVIAWTVAKTMNPRERLLSPTLVPRSSAVAARLTVTGIFL